MAQNNSRNFSYVGQNIRKIRLAKNISQSEFAALFQLSRPTVGAYEEGRTEPKIETLIQISSHFNISIDVLLTKELTSKDVYSLGLLNKRLDRAHESKPITKKSVQAPFISTTEKVNFLVNRHDRSYLEDLPTLGVPERLEKVDLVIENEGTRLQVDAKGVHHGDYLFCQEQKKLKSTPEQMWVLVTEDDLVVGRIASKSASKLKVTFDNPLYEPVELTLDQVQGTYLIVGVYSIHLSKPNSMEDRLRAIEEKLKKI